MIMSASNLQSHLVETTDCRRGRSVDRGVARWMGQGAGLLQRGSGCVPLAGLSRAAVVTRLVASERPNRTLSSSPKSPVLPNMVRPLSQLKQSEWRWAHRSSPESYEVVPLAVIRRGRVGIAGQFARITATGSSRSHVPIISLTNPDFQLRRSAGTGLM